MKKTIPCVLLTVMFVQGPVRAEVPLMSSAELKESAGHIVVGNVQAVYTTTKISDDYEDTFSVAEISVVTVEKGEQITNGGVIYAHYWNKRWIGKGRSQPGSSGHIGVAKGDVVRAYLQRKDRKYQILLPNGFEKLKTDQETEAPDDAMSDVQGKWVRTMKTLSGTYKIVKEHQGNTTTVTVFASDGTIVTARKSEFRLEKSGRAQIFTFFNNVITAGPQKGQTDKTSKSYIYRVIGNRFYEVNGLLSDNDEEPVTFSWERVRD